MSQPEFGQQQMLELAALELDVWDQQIATNLDAGDLEVLIGEALEDDRAGWVSKR